jgi:hypothetical protein
MGEALAEPIEAKGGFRQGQAGGKMEVGEALKIIKVCIQKNPREWGFFCWFNIYFLLSR